MKRQGQSPSHEALYTPELIDLVKKLYTQDINLYKAKCDEPALLFP
jgi:hypothetical protein